jgi:hypothetical protein
MGDHVNGGSDGGRKEGSSKIHAHSSRLKPASGAVTMSIIVAMGSTDDIGRLGRACNELIPHTIMR